MRRRKKRKTLTISSGDVNMHTYARCSGGKSTGWHFSLSLSLSATLFALCTAKWSLACLPGPDVTPRDEPRHSVLWLYLHVSHLSLISSPARRRDRQRKRSLRHSRGSLSVCSGTSFGVWEPKSEARPRERETHVHRWKGRERGRETREIRAHSTPFSLARSFLPFVREAPRKYWY